MLSFHVWADVTVTSKEYSMFMHRSEYVLRHCQRLATVPIMTSGHHECSHLKSLLKHSIRGIKVCAEKQGTT